MIGLKEVLFRMNSDTPFTVEVITCNRQQQTGGERRTFGPCLLNQSKWKANSLPKPDREDFKRFSNVNDNGTLTIRLLGPDPDNIRTIHKRLIRKFNGETVL